MTEVGVEIPCWFVGLVRYKILMLCTARHQNQRYVFHLGFGHRCLHVMSSLKGAMGLVGCHGWNMMEQWIIPYLQYPFIALPAHVLAHDFVIKFLKSQDCSHLSGCRGLQQWKEGIRQWEDEVYQQSPLPRLNISWHMHSIWQLCQITCNLSLESLDIKDTSTNLPCCLEVHCSCVLCGEA